MPGLLSETALTTAKTDAPDTAPVAELQVINFQRLAFDDSEERAKLFKVAQTDGFFYLDFRRSDNTEILDLVERIYVLAKDLFDLSDAEKLLYDVDKIGKMKLNGYKPMGRNTGGLDGKRDGFESYAIPKDGILGLSPSVAFPRPALVSGYHSTLASFMKLMLHVTGTILSSLSKSLEIDGPATLESFHRPSAASPDILRLLHYHAQPVAERGSPQTPHTDLGSLTVLFTKQPGLQVLRPGTASEWSHVLPRPGNAIINLGDGLSLLTNKFLHSCLHRVGPLPGKAMEERFSFAYLQRAEDQTPLTTLTSPFLETPESTQKVITSGEWLRKKFGVLRGETCDEIVLTGRKGALV